MAVVTMSTKCFADRYSKKARIASLLMVITILVPTSIFSQDREFVGFSNRDGSPFYSFRLSNEWQPLQSGVPKGVDSIFVLREKSLPDSEAYIAVSTTFEIFRFPTLQNYIEWDLSSAYKAKNNRLRELLVPGLKKGEKAFEVSLEDGRILQRLYYFSGKKGYGVFVFGSNRDHGKYLETFKKLILTVRTDL